MHIEKDTRIEVYSKSSSTQKYLYGSFQTGKILSSLIQKYHLMENVADIFIVTVGDIILGFYKIEDVIPLLKQELGSDEVNVEKLGEEVLEFLAPLSDPSWQPPLDEDEESISDTNESIPVLSNSNTHEAENSLSSNEPVTIPEIRTMASDMAHERSPARTTFNAVADLDEPVYVSSQPSLNHTAIDVPSYSTPAIHSPNSLPPTEDSRWG